MVRRNVFWYLGLGTKLLGLRKRPWSGLKKKYQCFTGLVRFPREEQFHKKYITQEKQLEK